MNSDTRVRPMPRVSVLPRAALVLALGGLLAACGKNDTAPTAGTPAASTAAPAATPATVISDKVTAMTADQLRDAAGKAYNENRLYAPAGDNAIEYYLALRDKSPNDPAVSSALTDLLPMAVIATEQSVARDDFSEAQRLTALLEKADPKHPALNRLKTSITEQQQVAQQRATQQQLTAEDQAKKQAELEKQRLEDQKKQQDVAAKQLADRASADKVAADKAAADKIAADKAAADKAAADRAAAEREAAQRAAAQTAAAPARPAAGGNSELRALSTPAPAFPPEALRSAQSGEVQVEFTVAADGSVTAARVVRANPPRIFDRAAVNAVKRWRFQPVDAPVTTRRTISFNPGT
ncbi:energy transducer TonB [Lysobacter claricitrinus]|uniref:energy transducer TonB n=1 Tax=Lysobacter claricitrinus TaxID=3367728 RepID=UPI0037DAA0C7